MARDDKSRSNGNGKSKKLTKTLVVGPFRMAFPALFEPEDTDNGERYKVTALFPPEYKIKELEDTLYEVFEAEFGTDESDWPRGRNDMLPKDKLYDAGGKPYQGFKDGWMAMSMSSKDAPGIIDADKNEVLSKREVYGGRWARAQISITTYNDKSKGIGVYLNHIQLLDHDEAFNGKGNASDAFDKYELKDRGRKRADDDDDQDDSRDSRSRDRGRGRDDDDRDNDRGSRSRDREDDRGGRSRSRDDEGNSRRGRDRDEGEKETRRDSRGRGRDEAEEDTRESRRSSRDSDRDEGRGRGRDRDDEDEDRRPSRSRSRDDDSSNAGRDRSSRGRDREAASSDEWN